VRNDSRQALTKVRVSGGGTDVVFGTIPPGGSEMRSSWISNNGKLEFQATGESGMRSQLLSRRALGDVHGNLMITVSADGSITTSNNENID
jgi:hypothetical protein